MARLHVKITEYVRDDDPVIAAAARAAYDASLHLWRLVEDRREQTTASTGSASAPGCDYGHNSRPPKAVQDAYIAATGGTQ